MTDAIYHRYTPNAGKITILNTTFLDEEDYVLLLPIKYMGTDGKFKKTPFTRAKVSTWDNRENTGLWTITLHTHPLNGERSKVWGRLVLREDTMVLVDQCHRGRFHLVGVVASK